ncbi:aromatic-ring-hydroxylating dioxygenase subunit beta [Oceanibacterium hippocampi]|uniref:Anthranilate 1,2-dioxygenase small subunit n=1 Tax=Oceanibacterium hippocampi TaxID=745714 RepID=A0A1Y5RAZ6_9PROT|nr:aromatic-ring-hydroxylating dioxygenase subunit beta [Oceanibacterium hippocampi]SLN13133.1 Anthranilate 1,2-dioxygenase small subunit [Oceanibacterium hippocampi]
MKENVTRVYRGRQSESRELRDLRRDLRDFYEEYTLAIDENELETWLEFFTDDAVYKAISRENWDLSLPLATMYCDGMAMLKDRVQAIRETAVFEPRSQRHFVSGVRLRGTEADGTILVQANYLVTEALSNRDPVVFSVGRYIDRVVRDDSGFRFREHCAVYDNYRVINTLVWPL